jgi:hypothetical protein
VQPEVEAACSGDLPVQSRGPSWQRPADWIEVPLTRLSSNWQLPPLPSGSKIACDAADREVADAVEYEWAGRTARHVGEVVHRWLQRITTAGLDQFDPRKIESLQPVFLRMLRNLGTNADELTDAVDSISEALVNAISDGRGRWILSGNHLESATEYPVTLMEGDRFEHLVLDRTFVTSDGVRWIVDYKTGRHEGGELAEFLESETSRHFDQLERYARAMAGCENLPIRTALYFPLMKIFHEVKTGGSE